VAATTSSDSRRGAVRLSAPSGLRCLRPHAHGRTLAYPGDDPGSLCCAPIPSAHDGCRARPCRRARTDHRPRRSVSRAARRHHVADRLSDTGTLWRHDVFHIAEGWRLGACTARDLAVATLMWDFGPTGYGPPRTEQILAADPDGHRLEAGLEPLRDGSSTADELRAAFIAFCPRQPAHVRDLGPAFFTKLLYFAGYRRGRSGVQPLILDSGVARALPEAAGAPRRRRGGWRSAEWMDYLRWAAEQAQRPAFDGEPERVEMALFAVVWIDTREDRPSPKP
jgi:hypothetical protein